MTKQESETLLAASHQLHHGIHTGADKIADHLMNRIRNPHFGQVTKTMLQGEFLRVPLGLSLSVREQLVSARHHRAAMGRDSTRCR